MDLSICIPAFGYSDGVNRALESLEPLTKKIKLEILVFEDPSDDPVKLRKGLNVTHVVNERSLGAPKNWNHAISACTGRYVWMLHHDEYLSPKTNVRDFINVLDSDKYDVLFSNLTKKNSPLLNYRLKILKPLFVRNPELLYKMNVIGSPSNIIYRNSFSEFYDERLRCYVDVEFYNRLLKWAKNLSIGAFDVECIPYARNIKNILGEKLRDIEKYERSLILREKIKREERS